jgi:bifunctional UDP-N-acetylglucosamine pyrophosphorylase/glucosamine-1-phosphate N-acetyltransferase
MRRRILDGLMMEGVTIIDPATTYIEPQVEIGPDTIIYPGTFLQGETKIGVGCQIGPYSQLRDSQIGDASQVRFSVLDHAKTGEGVNIGPYSFLRPGTVVEKNGKVGGFVETKNTQIGEGSKVPHLSYIGDCLIGTGVNIGAGTITCNYDGYAKHETVIGDGAFIGSNTNLVAPVLVGKGALVGAGSTITKDVPEDGLALARAKQIIKEKWVQRRKG